MEVFGEPEDKREVPQMLQKLLRYDVQITKKFVEWALRTSPLRSLRNHAKFLEIEVEELLLWVKYGVVKTKYRHVVSCHGIVWLAGWLTFIWFFNNKDLYQIQVNMLIALILDIILVAAMKAFIRRRRPIPMNKLMAVGPDKYSFPSGHTSRAVLVTLILTYVSPISPIFYPPLVAWTTAVALSRVLMERHYIFDVIGGMGLGLLVSMIMQLLWLSQSTSASILSTLSDEKIDGGEYHV